MTSLKPATKVAALCIGIIALAAIICFYLLGHYHLQKPVLIPWQTEYAQALPDDEDEDEDEETLDEGPGGLQCFFLTNGGDTRAIQEIEFAEASEIRFFGEYDEYDSDTGFQIEEGFGERIGLYRGGWVSLILDPRTDEFLAKSQVSITVKNAIIHYTDGSKETADMEPLTFHPPGGNNMLREEDPVSTFSKAAAYLKERGSL
ncbi:hypothetical protein P0G10_10090 [Eubacteriales bacterium DFI.9.88]|nr:hypothetical protein [Eubacteriales bacterium DFI.9.88]